jgi:hypothetical protein
MTIHIAARTPGYAICGWDQRRPAALVSDLELMTCRFCLRVLRQPSGAVLSEREACAQGAVQQLRRAVGPALRLAPRRRQDLRRAGLPAVRLEARRQPGPVPGARLPARKARSVIREHRRKGLFGGPCGHASPANASGGSLGPSGPPRVLAVPGRAPDPDRSSVGLRIDVPPRNYSAKARYLARKQASAPIWRCKEFRIAPFWGPQ